MVRWSSWLLGLLKTEGWAIRSLRQEGRGQCSLAAARLLDSGDCVLAKPSGGSGVGPGNSQGPCCHRNTVVFAVCSLCADPASHFGKGFAEALSRS